MVFSVKALRQRACFIRRQTLFKQLFLLSSLLLSACIAEKSLTVPPITGQISGQYQTGKFVWFDLLTHNAAAAKLFYGGLFAWRFRTETADPDNVIILHRGKAIGSIVSHFENITAGDNAVWLSSLSIADVEKASKIVTRLGGEVMAGPVQLKGRGQFAIVADAQGARLALLHAENGDPSETKTLPGTWLWSELWTTDMKKAAYFYKTLIAYETQLNETTKSDGYHLFKRDGIKIASMVELPWQAVKPNWLPYVLVLDIHNSVAKTQTLGGRVIIAPSPAFAQGRVAVIADPSGGVLAIQELRK